MKKTIILFLMLALLIPAAGCGNQKLTADVDLTGLEGEELYYSVCDLTMSPSEFLGKNVRLTGQFLIYSGLDEDGQVIPDQNYYVCRVIDPTGCLFQEIEFVPTGNPVLPDDFPRLGSPITVQGTFDTYEEDGQTYYRLLDATMEF